MIVANKNIKNIDTSTKVYKILLQKYTRYFWTIKIRPLCRDKDSNNLGCVFLHIAKGNGITKNTEFRYGTLQHLNSHSSLTMHTDFLYEIFFCRDLNAESIERPYNGTSKARRTNLVDKIFWIQSEWMQMLPTKYQK